MSLQLFDLFMGETDPKDPLFMNSSVCHSRAAARGHKPLRTLFDVSQFTGASNGPTISLRRQTHLDWTGALYKLTCQAEQLSKSPSCSSAASKDPNKDAVSFVASRMHSMAGRPTLLTERSAMG